MENNFSEHHLLSISCEFTTINCPDKNIIQLTDANFATIQIKKGYALSNNHLGRILNNGLTTT